MPEQEVKLHVPRAASQAIARELVRDGATRIGLQAMYFDTPQRELAAARIALRLRREGDQWVQTLKMPGADAISRVELNHQRPGPILDLSVYAGTDQEAPLSALRGELGVCYETDVSRLLRNVRTREGTVEVSHDTGCLRGGGLDLPIDEIEFELVSGRPAAIFRLAHRWQQRHRLILDPRSKSERGDALAQTAVALAQAAVAGNVANAGTGVGGAGLGSPGINGVPDAAKAAEAARAREIARYWAPRGAASIKLTDDMDPEQALACMTAECLQQIARNAAVLSEVDTEGVYDAGKAEHVHQLRVGIRRLRSAWRLMQGWTPLPPETARNALRDYFAEFGANRDQDVQEETVLPMLRAAGMPNVELPRQTHGNDARSLASSPHFQSWLLDMLQWCVTPEAARIPPRDARAAAASTAARPAHSPTVPTIIPLTNEPVHTPLRTRLARRLRRWHRKVVQDGLRFAELTTPEKHAVRKRAKRLRYGLAFAESLMPTHRIRSYRKRLAQVQDILGEFNDLAVAREHYAQRTEQFPQAWFAGGWIAARQEALTHQAAAAFKRLAKSPPFWK